MSILSISVVVSTTCAIGAPQLDDQHITDAIAMIAGELNSRHDSVLCWEPRVASSGWLSKHEGGTTAITTLALLASGESSYAPNVQQAMEYLWEIEEPSSYVLALRTSIWTMLPDKYKRRLKRDTKRLLNTMGLDTGGWGMGSRPPKSRVSASPLIREFCVIALRESRRQIDFHRLRSTQRPFGTSCVGNSRIRHRLCGGTRRSNFRKVCVTTYCKMPNTLHM